MANRAPALDDKVFSISDLVVEGNKRLPKSYRDFYNEGAMDMITYVVSAYFVFMLTIKLA